MGTIDDFNRSWECKSSVDEAPGKLVQEVAWEGIVPVRRNFDEGCLEHKLMKPIVEKPVVDLGLQGFLLPDHPGRAMNLMALHGAEREFDLEKHRRDVKIVELGMGSK